MENVGLLLWFFRVYCKGIFTTETQVVRKNPQDFS